MVLAYAEETNGQPQTSVQIHWDLHLGFLPVRFEWQSSGRAHSPLAVSV